MAFLDAPFLLPVVRQLGVHAVPGVVFLIILAQTRSNIIVHLFIEILHP
jgi:hypothetical protein